MVTSMLEKAIEIEGLLRIIRDGNPLPETYILLNMKAAELAELAECLEEKASVIESGKSQTQTPKDSHVDLSESGKNKALTPINPFVDPHVVSLADSLESGKTQAESDGVEPEPKKPYPGVAMEASDGNDEQGNAALEDSETEVPHADFVMEVPDSQATSVAKVIFTMEPNTPEEGSLTSTINALTDLGEDDFSVTPEDLALIEEDDILLSFEDTTEFSIPEITPETPSAPMPEKEKQTENEAAKEESTFEEHAAETISMASDNEETEINLSITENNEIPKTKTDGPAPTASKRQIKLKSAFSLNDRFLYARELFNGNMKMFDSTLDFIEGIEDYSIIEDYFYSELEWNPENTNVATFMDILRPHFRE